MSERPTLSASIQEIEAIARSVISELPEQFRTWLQDVVLLVEDFPSDDVADSMGLDSPFDLLGLYHGHPLIHRSVELSGALPDRIHLYRKPILAYARQNGLPLDATVRHVLIHEIGHHFGYSDEEMERIDSEPD